MKPTTTSTTDIRTVWKARVLAMLVIGWTAWLVYANALDGIFFMDDQYHIVEHPKQIDRILQALPGRLLVPGREVADLTFALSNRIHGTAVNGYRIVNVALHALNSCLVYWLIVGLIRMFKPRINTRDIYLPNDSVALVGAMLFTVHPLFSACVNYAVQRYTLMVTTFYLLAIILYVKARITTAASRRLWYGGAAVAGWLAFHTKEIGITLPLVLIYMELFLVPERPLLRRRVVGTALLVLPAFGAVGVAELYGMGWFDSAGAALWSPWQQFQAESVAFVHYWKMLFVPLETWMNVDHDFRVPGLLVDTGSLAALAFHLAVIAGAGILLKNGRKLAATGIGWFYLSLLPYWVVPEADLLVDYKAYLPGVGFVLMVADLTIGRPRARIANPILIRTAAVAIICLFAVATMNRNLVYGDPLRLWEDTARKSPNKARVLNNRGFAYHQHGEIAKAIADYTAAIKRSPSYARPYENRGCLHFSLANYAAARADFEKAISLNTHTARTYTNLGNTWLALSNHREAIRCYDKAISIDAGYAEAYYNRGVAHAVSQQWADAWIDFNSTLRVAPSHRAAQTGRLVMAQRIESSGADDDVDAVCDAGPHPSVHASPQIVTMLD